MTTQSPPRRQMRPFSVTEELAPQRQEALDERRRKTDRPTSVWYWRPPVVRGSSLTTTGLFQDCFYSKDGWRERMVIREREKFGVDLSGEEVYNELVLPVEAHGLTVGGTPVVVMRHLGWDGGRMSSSETWAHIREVMERNRPLELEREQDMLEGVEHDLPSSASQSERTGLRERVRIFQRRVATLEAGYDWDGLEAFWVSEIERRVYRYRSALQRREDEIQGIVERVVSVSPEEMVESMASTAGPLGIYDRDAPPEEVANQPESKRTPSGPDA